MIIWALLLSDLASETMASPEFCWSQLPAAARRVARRTKSDLSLITCEPNKLTSGSDGDRITLCSSSSSVLSISDQIRHGYIAVHVTYTSVLPGSNSVDGSLFNTLAQRDRSSLNGRSDSQEGDKKSFGEFDHYEKIVRR